MSRFAEPVFVAAGLRTPFGRGSGALANYDAVSLSVPVVQAMANLAGARSGCLGTRHTQPGMEQHRSGSLAGRQAQPQHLRVLRCPSVLDQHDSEPSLRQDCLAAGTDLTMVGGAEVMSRPSLAFTAEASKRLTDLFGQDPAAALSALQSLTPRDFVLPTKGWANRITGRTMGDRMEETAKAWRVSREAQDDWALKSHQRAVAGWDNGFFDDLVISLPELARDANPRADTSAERLAALKPAFDRESGQGSLTAGNSSPSPMERPAAGLPTTRV